MGGGHHPPPRAWALGRALVGGEQRGPLFALLPIPKNHIYSKKISVNFYRVWTPFDMDFLRIKNRTKKQELALSTGLVG